MVYLIYATPSVVFLCKRQLHHRVWTMHKPMGVNPGGGDAGTRSPSFWSGGDEYLIIPPLFDMFNEILFLGYLKT